MSRLPHPVRAWGRAGLRLAFRLCRFAFILALVALPVPLTAWLVVVLEPLRRSVPTQVLREKKDRDAQPSAEL